MKQQGNKSLTLKNLSKSNIWDLQENDVFRLLENGEKDADMKDNINHYADIIRSAFTIEVLDSDVSNVKKKQEKLGYKVGSIKLEENTKLYWAIKKRPIMRVTDLTYENIHHISAAKLVEVLDRNFGGGWESIAQSIQDIIESGFDISTTTLPKDRLHKAGGMYEKKVADGFEVLEISKGSWIEAIFAKEKPIVEKPRIKFDGIDGEKLDGDDDNINDEEDITEENYRTTFSIDKNKDEDEDEDDKSEEPTEDE
jgi:hypothetical protein